MKRPAKLTDILEALAMQSDELMAYLNKETGEVVMVTEEAMFDAEFAESLDDRAEWEKQEIELARSVMENDTYLPLPDRFEINEYRIMERFAGGFDEDAVAERLLRALQGRGAFRRFKDEVHMLGAAEVWYEYRGRAIEAIATEWCEAQDIPFTRDQTSGSDA